MDLVPSPSPRGIRRSFAFVAVCGLDDVIRTRGTVAAVAEVCRFRGAVRELAADAGVRVASWFGDGALVIGIEREPLVGAIEELHRRMHLLDDGLCVRSGVATGDVLLVDGQDYIGSAVSVAARLCTAAGPRQVLVAPGVLAFGSDVDGSDVVDMTPAA